MLHATVELARRVERAEIDFCALGAGAGIPGGAATLEVGGGRAVCGAPGLPMNKVLGLGVGCHVSDDELDAIDDFYDERGVPPQIELCPLAGGDLASRLTGRGYRLHAFENELAREAPGQLIEEDSALSVTRVDTDREHLWIDVVSRGFVALEASSLAGGSIGRDPLFASADVTAAIAGVMKQFVSDGIRRYLAFAGDEPAGGAAACILDGVMSIFGTATLPAFRRRGVQRLVVARAMNDALGQYELATATTEPGSTSQRTFERLGFQLLYTRAILVRP